MSAYPELLATRETTLLDLLDTILDKGVVAQGDLTISVADVDLVFVGIKLVLASVETMESWRKSAQPDHKDGDNGHEQQARRDEVGSRPLGRRQAPAQQDNGNVAACSHGADTNPPLQQNSTPIPKNSTRRLPADPDKVEQGLAKLVLTVVELLRRLLEKQAVRRMEGGSLREDEIELMGRAFQRLEQKMEELKVVFGLEGEDLNLALGPLGNLM
jgi:hypothetical protein